MIEEIMPKAPFDFRQMLRRPLSRLNKTLAIHEPELSYQRLLRLGDKIVPLYVRFTGDVDTPKLLLNIPDSLNPTECMQLRKIVRHTFSVDIDLLPVYSQLSEQPEIGALMCRFYGLRPVLEPDLFEAMIKIIIGQQLNVSFVATLIDRLIELAGDTVVVKGIPLAVFPSPEAIASLSYEQLKGLSFNQRKAEYVIDFARTVADGRLDMQKLWALPHQAVNAELSQLRGIGKWTVDCMLLFGLGRTDVFPSADIAVRQAMKQVLGLPGLPTAQEAEQLAADWSPWRSYVTYYLWQSLIRR